MERSPYIFLRVKFKHTLRQSLRIFFYRTFLFRNKVYKNKKPGGIASFRNVMLSASNTHFGQSFNAWIHRHDASLRVDKERFESFGQPVVMDDPVGLAAVDMDVVLRAKIVSTHYLTKEALATVEVDRQETKSFLREQLGCLVIPVGPEA